MKDLYYLFAILFVTSLHAQSLHKVDFEANGVGNDWSWTDAEGGTSSLVDNPSTTGINTSAKVISLTKTSTSQNWALTFTDDDGEFTFDADNDEIKVKVYKPVTSDFCIKFERTGGDQQVCVSNTQTNKWEELTFDFSSVIGSTYTRIVIIPDNAASGAGVHYFDDLIVPDGVVAPAPTDAPTTPPARDAADVISIYGDTYETAIGVNNVDWDQGSDSVEETIAGNAVLKTTYNDFLGLDLGSEVDASGMTHMHMDFWIADDYAVGQVFKPKWSNHNGSGETDAFDYTYAVAENDSQSWLSIDVALDDFVTQAGGGSAARANLKQLVIGVAATLDLVYIDNIYFYIAQTASIDDLQNNIHVYPNPAKDTVRISAAESIDRMRIYDLTGRLVKQASPHKAAFSVDVSGLSKGVYLVKLNAGDREATTKMIK